MHVAVFALVSHVIVADAPRPDEPDLGNPRSQQPVAHHTGPQEVLLSQDATSDARTGHHP
jgi:hypothetical protein